MALRKTEQVGGTLLCMKRASPIWLALRYFVTWAAGMALFLFVIAVMAVFKLLRPATRLGRWRRNRCALLAEREPVSKELHPTPRT